MILDDLGWSLMISEIMIFHDFWLFSHMVRSILLQVTRGSQTGPREFLLSAVPVTLWSKLSNNKIHDMDHGAKQSPPGPGWSPDWSQGVPPVWFPSDPLTQVISGQSSWYGSFSYWTIMISDVLSYYIHAVCCRWREPLSRSHFFWKS